VADAVKLGDLTGMEVPDFTAQAVVVPKGSVSCLFIKYFILSSVKHQVRQEILTGNQSYDNMLTCQGQ
jgi:hypothetical protein